MDTNLSPFAVATNQDFSRILQKQMDYYNDNPNSDNITRVRDQLENVKEVMVQNIEKVLERGEKIELLVDKTDQMKIAGKGSTCIPRLDLDLDILPPTSPYPARYAHNHTPHQRDVLTPHTHGESLGPKPRVQSLTPRPLFLAHPPPLNTPARKFEKSSKRLKNAEWWRNAKMWIIIFIVLAILVFFIAAIACGGMLFPKCSGSAKTPTTTPKPLTVRQLM